MNNPLILIALINHIENTGNKNNLNVIDLNNTKKHTYYTKPSYDYSYKRKNNRSINQPRNRGTNHMKAIRQPKNIIY